VSELQVGQHVAIGEHNGTVHEIAVLSGHHHHKKKAAA
jgi:hypothetical protein